jgi:hypothetical protein
VKKGWHLLHSSTRRVCLVEPVVKLLPHEQVTVASGKYFGWIFSFMIIVPGKH